MLNKGDIEMTQLVFPKSFIFGTATASYQIEGAWNKDGKGENIWDRFSHQPGNVLNGDTGDVACDHYHRYEEDIQLMKELGIDSYRLSISWARIFPEGAGGINQKGVDFYIKLLHLLQQAGIKPAVTLYHWDLPQKLQDKGGWANRESIQWFNDYAKFCFEKFGQYVDKWITFNEPWVSAFLGYAYGNHAPGIRDYHTALQVSHHILLAHGQAVKSFRQGNYTGKIGITLNVSEFYPFSQREKDIQAASRAKKELVDLFLSPIYKKRYPQALFNWYKDLNLLPDIKEGDLDKIAQPVDFLGINYYLTHSTIFDETNWPLKTKTVSRGLPTTDMEWEIHPEGLYDILNYIQKTYNPNAIEITENGRASKDVVNFDGNVLDYDRIDYLERHFSEAVRAINDGVKLTAYYIWSMLDNFEWAFGYSKRFGIVYVDFKTGERIPKQSYYWYKKLIEENKENE